MTGQTNLRAVILTTPNELSLVATAETQGTQVLAMSRHRSRRAAARELRFMEKNYRRVDRSFVFDVETKQAWTSKGLLRHGDGAADIGKRIPPQVWQRIEDYRACRGDGTP